MKGAVDQLRPDVSENTGNVLQSAKKYALIVGSALCALTAFRNTLTWLIQSLWGASGSFWQELWLSIFKFCGENEFNISVYGTQTFAMVSFVILNVIFTYMDCTGKPAWLTKYKIQPEQNAPMDRKKYARAVRQVLLNLTLVSTLVVLAAYPVMRWRGCQLGAQPLPTFQWVLLEIIVFTFVEEAGFYYSHRLFHHPALYKHIHKRHHEWTASISIISIYCHPLEHVVCNLAPLVLGPILMGSHLASLWLWLMLATFSTTVAHCGYHLPLLPSPEAHDFHHLKFVNNFGVMGVLDRLHGTDTLFRSSVAYKRHALLTDLTPMCEHFPDKR